MLNFKNAEMLNAKILRIEKLKNLLNSKESKTLTLAYKKPSRAMG